MTRRPNLVASLAVVALTSCQCNSLRIEGDVSNLPDGPIYLSVLDSTLHWSPIDTATVDGGHFLFDGHTRLGGEECVILTRGDVSMVVFAGNDKVRINGNALRPEEIEVSGSAINDALIEFTNGIPGKERLSQIAALLCSTANNVDKREELAEEANAIKKSQADYIRKSILSNSSNALGPFILLNHISLLSFEEAQSFAETFKATQPTHKYVSLIEHELNKHRKQYEAQKRTSIGQPSPEINLPNVSGGATALSSLRGKVVLIDFWTSGNEACKKNHQTIGVTFDKFESKGFAVLGIYVGNDTALWKTTIKDENLRGKQTIDRDGVATEAYGVRELPATYLVDEYGIIVAKDVDGESIFADIEDRMNKHTETTN